MALNNREISNKVRVYHRYLGFFLTGIMFMYALSGITLTFRDKEYFKKEVFIEKIIEKDLKELPPPGRGVKNVEYNKITGDEHLNNIYDINFFEMNYELIIPSKNLEHV